jgi:hypothetical protein
MREYRWIHPCHAQALRGQNLLRFSVLGPLTDKAIEKYRQQGRYSAEYREARRTSMQNKRVRRHGAFVEVDGRMIYSPL